MAAPMAGMQLYMYTDNFMSAGIKHQVPISINHGSSSIAVANKTLL